MTTKTVSPIETLHTSDSVSPVIPPLRDGDRLTRREFERRYEAMPHIKKAELIEGVVYMPAAVRIDHGKPHAAIIAWLSDYWIATPGIELYDNVSVQLDEWNEVQPDALLRIDEAHGGQSRINSDDYLEGPAELIVEVAGSSASRDLNLKLQVYQRNGVQEYIVWETRSNRLTWFSLQKGQYVSLVPDKQGMIHSQIFPGLCLDVQALLTNDLRTVIAVLQHSIDSQKHKAFVERLSK
jgi:Uma2 family endonuclease